VRCDKRLKPNHLGCFKNLSHGITQKVATPDTIYPGPKTASVLAQGTQVLVQWVNPPSDSRQTTFVVRRATGSTPPAGISDGTGIAMSISALTNGTVDSTTTSNTVYSWTIFLKYTEANGVVGYSDPTSITANSGEPD
jgi:hypothetical protein